MKIKQVRGREILDSRGNPTVEATVILENGVRGVASVPSGASTGIYEALEMRDGDDKRYGGKGVLRAVNHVNTVLHDALVGSSASFFAVDRRMAELDGTENKAKLGANATLAVSLATAKAASAAMHLPLYRYLGGAAPARLPIPMMNILNGGAHADNNLDVQEFMIVPCGFSSFSEALRAGVEIYHVLRKNLASAGKSTAVGDEGGFAPNLSGEEETIEVICRAIRDAGYDTDRVKIALDAASSEWYEDGVYVLPKQKRTLTREELIEHWQNLTSEYPILSLEDAVGETDRIGWKLLSETLGGQHMLVGDDFFVTNPTRLRDGIREGLGNSVLVKPNQIGTLSETVTVCQMAHEAGYASILSHRSGDTGDTAIADIAVALGAGFIKTGAPCRGERVAKYNRLLAIEAELGARAVFGQTML